MIAPNEDDPVLADVDAALIDLLQDLRTAKAGKGLKSATQIYSHAFASLSTQEIASDGIPIRDLFRQIAFNSATIAILCRKLIAAEDEMKAVKSIYNLP